MKNRRIRRTVVAVGAAFLASVLFAADWAAAQRRTPALPTIIDQNIRAAVASSDRLANNQKAPELWIHVRSGEQKRQVEEKWGWFQNLQAAGVKVDLRPLRLVANGPPQSQLRFFREADQAQAQALLIELRKGIPAVVIQNLSAQYKQATWVDPGHFELWLAPSISRIGP
jgi:hypothetical protein